MQITERREVTRVQVEDVLIGRRCDVCGGEIVKEAEFPHWYNYFVIRTHHSDWGNDSIDSLELKDACCAECALKYAGEYIRDAYKRVRDTETIEIEHVNSLEAGAYKR